jgi:hypothetical protein
MWLGRKGKVQRAHLQTPYCVMKGLNGLSVRPYSSGFKELRWNRWISCLQGLYTSPHIAALRDRIRINGKPISEEDFARYFFEVADRLEATKDQVGVSFENASALANDSNCDRGSSRRHHHSLCTSV